MSDFEREERAFRAALARAADGFEPRELAIPGASEEPGPADLSDETEKAEEKASVRRKAPWILAAAAAVLAVVGLGGVVANLQPTGGGESTAASDASGAEDAGGAPKPLTDSDELAPEGTYI